jgi:hypothetical protein
VGTTGAGWSLTFVGWYLAFACCPGALVIPAPLPFGTPKEAVVGEEAGDGLVCEGGGKEEDGDCGCGADPWPSLDGGGGCSV